MNLYMYCKETDLSKEQIKSLNNSYKKVQFISENNFEPLFKCEEAKVISHEYDHLNGVLHFDLINKNEIMELNLEQRKIYREQHPYEIISKICNYDKPKK